MVFVFLVKIRAIKPRINLDAKAKRRKKAKMPPEIIHLTHGSLDEKKFAITLSFPKEKRLLLEGVFLKSNYFVC